MTAINIFEYATRHKLRFPFKGQQTVEDLWSLSVEDLDSIFRTLNRESKREGEESLLVRKTPGNEGLDVKIQIVRHIVNVKQTEAAEAAQRVKNEQKVQKLMALLDRKENDALENLTPEEIKAQLADLGHVIQ